jgi:hypothetical protein
MMASIRGHRKLLYGIVLSFFSGSICLMKLDIMSREFLVKKCEDGKMMVGADIKKPNFGLIWYRIGFSGELWT